MIIHCHSSCRHVLCLVHVGMFYALTVQLSLHGHYAVELRSIFFFFVVDLRWGNLFRFQIRGIERLPLLSVSRLPCSASGLWLFNLLRAHATYSDCESEELKGFFFLFALPFHLEFSEFHCLLLCSSAHLWVRMSAHTTVYGSHCPRKSYRWFLVST